MRTWIAWLVAWAMTATLADAQVVINEIFYRAPEDLDELEWVELYNGGQQAVDLSGWALKKGAKYTFPKDTRIEAGGYVVVCRLSKLIAQHSLDTVFSFLIHANTIAAASSLTHRGVRYIQSIQTTQPRPRWHWWLQGVIHVAADTIVVPSPSVAQVAEQWAGIPRSKIVVIPNAVEMGEYQRGCPSRQVDPPVPIGFIGRLDPIKRLPDLLDAVKLLAGKVHLHIFGDGRERPIIESRIQALAITPWVTLHGSIPNPHQALSQIDLLVLPSEAEGFGLVLIEAMAARIPVIATNVPGIRDVVQDRQTGLLVPVAQPQAFADAIAKLTADAPLRSTLVAQAFQDVNNRFSWDAVLPQYLRLLQL